ncbi:FtsX-like permease family protein [Bifidobacterium vansinderenii]|uniref:FtsX-like permease family n=1 Tax=Bifidobacterium vansinderenii TaxID=1984871 RepID=A0A229VV33_9BIFI|nr:FtsX-like permease family protein [Bifidobacterium vansinderenii]OXM99470.1 FtsX-like permease family [Bifidobacterium vansinderenii]
MTQQAQSGIRRRPVRRRPAHSAKGRRPPRFNTAFGKDIRRTIAHNGKRFVSILSITALGVTMATGLHAACDDLLRSADSFFDRQNLYDVSVVSTMGLTEDDINALAKVKGVDDVRGGHSEEVGVTVDGGKTTATLSQIVTGFNTPYVLDGRLPNNGDEVATTSAYLNDSGAKIGDKVSFGTAATEKDDDTASGSTEIFARRDYTIVGTVIDPTNTNNSEGATAFRDTSTTPDYTFFTTAAAVNDSAKDVYTAAYVHVDGSTTERAYSDGYTNLVDGAKTAIEAIQSDRETARTQALKADAHATVDEEESKANDELGNAQTQIDNARAELTDQQNRIDEQERQLDAQEEQLKAAQSAEQANGQTERNSRTSAQSAQTQAQLQAAQAQAEAAAQQIAEGRAQIESAKQQIAEAQSQLDARQTELDQKKAEAQQKITDARADVENIADARWYVRDRMALGGYASIDSDTKSINAIGTVFPVMFLLVAVLISLTAITRMVEEDRGLIGTYKALGYRRSEILRKYVVYALLACLAGGILGDLLGFIAMPKIIFSIFETMYLLPAFTLHFDWVYGLTSVALFVVAIVGSAIWSCRSELRLSPAALMRPKAPRAGKRILLERIGFLWKRMSFLNKVTARNLFRYKSRAFMTIAGIMGCTMLLMCGFAIKDSVVELSPSQYGGVYDYDLMAVTGENDHDSALDELRQNKQVKDVQSVRIDSGTLNAIGGNREESVQIMVVPKGGDISGYIHLREAQSDYSAAIGGGAPVTLSDTGVAVTKNAQQMLGLAEGGQAHLKDSSLNGVNVTVDSVVENYLGNTVYMTQPLYEKLFGEYKANGMLAHLNGDPAGQIDFSDTLRHDDRYLSVTSTAELVRDFRKNFTLINTVVYVLLVLAGALAFVVLFTLGTTNISERQRELATIKVLGFRKGEVRHYVNKEMIILTLIGVALGLPFGRLVAEGFTVALRMPSMYFAVHAHWISYVYSAALALGFALIVTLVTNRMLDRIDMVSALKSPE